MSSPGTTRAPALNSADLESTPAPVYSQLFRRLPSREGYNSWAGTMDSVMSLIHTTREIRFAEAVARVLNNKGIPSCVVSQDCLAGLGAPIPDPYCVHIQAESDRSRANAVLSKLGAGPLSAPCLTWMRLGLISVVLSLMLAAQSWS
jgi:hypothetical protein